MGKVLDAIIATMIPSGSIYRNQKPLLSLEIGKDLDISKAFEEAIGNKKVLITRVYGNRLLMPWDIDITGKTMEVIDLLNSMHEEGFPSYDTDLRIIQLYKGTGRFGRKRYMICLNKEACEIGYPHSGIEVRPAKN